MKAIIIVTRSVKNHNIISTCTYVCAGRRRRKRQQFLTSNKTQLRKLSLFVSNEFICLSLYVRVCVCIYAYISTYKYNSLHSTCTVHINFFTNFSNFKIANMIEFIDFVPFQNCSFVP